MVKAVDGVDFAVYPGEVLGLVGESGCGKSVTSFSIMRLVGIPGKIVDGEILFEGRDLLKLPRSEMVKMRGNRISMIFQQPQSSLNPVFTVGDQVAEVLQIHEHVAKKQSWDRAVELLKLVGISDAGARPRRIPHEMSGGQAQRVMIAMALALNPKLLIADEPTTALDVTIQAQILDLMRDLRAKMGTSVILITHDLGVIAEMADRVAVMYAGRIVEQAEVNALFEKPLHPYTQGLIGSIPVLGKVTERLDVIPGSVPNLVNLPPGCRFAPRCRARVQYDLSICTEIEPDLDGGRARNTWCAAGCTPISGDHKAPITPVELHEPIEIEEGMNSMILANARTKEFIQVEHLKKYFPVRGGILQRVVAWVQAVDDVSFTIREGESLGLVGESGCGKTTVGRTMLRLIEPTAGSVIYQDTDVFKLKGRELKAMRRNMQIIFQDPYASLDPRMPIGESVMEGLKIHGIGTPKERWDLAIQTLAEGRPGRLPCPALSRTSSRAVSASGSASPAPWHCGPSLSSVMSRFRRWMFRSSRRC